jgi:hypothetical protein
VTVKQIAALEVTMSANTNTNIVLAVDPSSAHSAGRVSAAVPEPSQVPVTGAAAWVRRSIGVRPIDLDFSHVPDAGSIHQGG